MVKTVKTTPKRKTKPKIEIDLKKVEQYAQVCDNEEEIALALGISYSTLQSRKRENEEFRTTLKRGRAKSNIFVGGQLMKLIGDGNVTAIIFYLKSRCGWKETDRHELTGRDGNSIEVSNQAELSGLSNEQLLELIRMNDEQREMDKATTRPRAE